MLGIVIANWNGEKLIEKCLQSIIKQNYNNIKIYIIDNGSSDNSINKINKFNNKLNIQLTKLKENTGFANANNIGINQAINDNCEYILTLNNDIEVSENALENAMKFIYKNNQYDVFQLFMINYFDRNKCDAAGLIFNKSLIPIQVGFEKSVKDINESSIGIEGVCAGAAIYSKKALEKTKLKNGDFFDSDFFAYFEDVDLSLRLRQAGFKAAFIKESVVYHMHSATSKQSNGFKEYYLSRNLFIYTKRNQSEKSFNKNKRVYYIRIVKNIIKSKGNIEIIKSIFKGAKDGINKSKNINYLY